MNQTQDQSQETGETRRDRLDHLDQLRRSRTDRHIAGVAGGLGRFFNIDPTVIRVALAVLIFFGGAGLIIYGAVWLLVPEEGEQRAPIEVSSEPRRILLIVALVLAACLAVGDSFSGFSFGWPLAVVAVAVALYLAVRDRRTDTPAVAAAQGGTPMSTTTTGPADTGDTGDTATPTADTRTAPLGDAAPPGDGRRFVPAYTPPRRPRRTGIVWFWPTLALIAVGCGILGLYDADHTVLNGAYPALALAISGVMLVVGSVTGRPGGLVFIGALASLALSAQVAVGGAFGADARHLHETPQSAAEVSSSYTATVGEIVLDLSEVRDPEQLAGRSIDVSLRTGQVRVIVPRDLAVDVDAGIDFAGGIEIDGDQTGGFNRTVHRLLPASDGSTAAPLELDIEEKFGQITIERK